MYRIGDFSKLSQAPVKTLRYYDEIGLLRPAVIDRFTRYRYYTDEQLATLQRIRDLKEMGFSLEKIAYLVESEIPAQQLARMLHMRRSEILEQIRSAQAQLAQVEARLAQLDQGDGQMKEPKIVKMDSFKVVGLRYVGKNEHSEVSELWVRANPRFGEIPNIAKDPNAAIGLCIPNPQGQLDYIAGLPVSDLEHVPQGMDSKEVPAQTYVVFDAHGVPDIMPTYKTILEDWLPNSNYLPGDGPDFEYYPPEFDPQAAQTSTLQIYFPIKEKE